MTAQRRTSLNFENARRFSGRVKRLIWSEVYKFKSPEQIFSSTYKNNFWGSKQQILFNSGTGTHNIGFVEEYVKSVRQFLGDEIYNLSAVDIGCGDFKVGDKIFRDFKSYTAVDVVPKLISYNKEKFTANNLQFIVADAITDSIPKADLIFIRQVLQHLSNQSIAKIIANLPKNFRYLIVTEHLPLDSFHANLDIRTGPETRLKVSSGVVLHLEPFLLAHSQLTDICDLPSENGTIRTTVYSPK